MAELPDLKGIATEEQVQTIGAGKYAARYINWARTMNMLREHAPGWFVDLLPSGHGSRAGSLIHEAPVGGYLMLRLAHLDGTVTPYTPHAIMDNRRQSIPIDKITSRNVTDAQRRGACLVIAQQTGLGAELWAKDPLESGFADEVESGGEVSAAVSASLAGSAKATDAAPSDRGSEPATPRHVFLQAAEDKGLSPEAAAFIANTMGSEKDKKADYSVGMRTLPIKTAAWVKEMNLAHQSAEAPKQ